MEINGAQSCGGIEPFPSLDGCQNTATTFPTSSTALVVPSHSHQALIAPEMSGSTLNSSTFEFSAQMPHTSHRHTMMFVDPRPAKSESTGTRPLSMTAIAGAQPLNLQTFQDEYLPQLHVPFVQPPKITQTSLGHSMPPAKHNTAQHANEIPLDPWVHVKSCGELDFSNLDTEVLDYSRGSLGIDDDAAVIDLRKLSYLGRDHVHESFTDSSRRMSESTNSISSHGPFADLPQFDDSPPSDGANHDSDWMGFDPLTRPQMDPTSSPRPPSLFRSASRSRASPAPSLRSSPYTLESTRNKRWSTGMYQGQPIPTRPQPMNRYSSYFGPQVNLQSAFANLESENVHMRSTPQHLFPSAHLRPTSQLLCPTSDPFLEIPRPLPSQGIFQVLQSSADRTTGFYSHCADLSDPPDLFSSLEEKPTDPPEEDMKPTDPDMVPHEQDLRFPGDLYTPKWVRGQGNKREGWCGLCKPGRWLVLKNSAFWYDKSFSHGVSAATGMAFQGPQDTRRTDSNLDIWEGLCGSCNDWIALVSSKKKGTTWFRHAYKCHSHPKAKDGSKRRKEFNASSSSSTDVPALSEPTITISSGTPTSSGELALVPESSGELEDRKVRASREATITTLKFEEDSTPVSTPQISHVSISGALTPSSQSVTPMHRKRFSVVFDNSNWLTAYQHPLSTFVEHSVDPISVNLPAYLESSSAVAQHAPSELYSGSSSDFIENWPLPSTITQPVTEGESSTQAPVNTSYQIFPSPQPHRSNTSYVAQTMDYKMSQPPEGNWI